MASAAVGVDSLSFKPAVDQGPYFTVEQSQTLGQWGYALGLSADLADDPIVIETPSGVHIQDVIQKQFALQFGAALGLWNWLNLGVGFSASPYQQFLTPATLVQDNGFRVGDIGVNFKARLLDSRKYPVGLAAMPFVTFPTGQEKYFAGNGKITGGGLVILDVDRLWDRLSLSLNAGARLRDRSLTGAVLHHQFLYGVGANLKIVNRLQFVTEAGGWTTFENFFTPGSATNLEINGGLRWLPGKSLSFTAGGGTGILDGLGAPDWRVFIGASYRHAQDERQLPAPPVSEEVIATDKIHFQFNRWVIVPSSYPVLDEIVNAIQDRSGVTGVRIEGYTDSVGRDSYNQKLSEKRAGVVGEYMAGKGYPAEKITAVGKGESEPVADNGTKAGRAQNRRVEFHLQLDPEAKIRVHQKSTAPTYEDFDKRPETNKN